MVAIAPVRSLPETEFVARIQEILLAVNTMAKDAASPKDRRLLYRVKDEVLNHLIATRAAATGAVRVSGQYDNGRPTVVVTLESRRQTRNFHLPVDCLSPTARAAATGALGPLARTFGLQ
jgi:hypothetical protein